jgi:hypothetical protein
MSASVAGLPAETIVVMPPVPVASAGAPLSAQTPSLQRPLVHCTSKLHGAPSAAAFACPHVPSSPATLSAARQRSLAAHVRSQQMPSSQWPLAHSSPREHDGTPASIDTPSCAAPSTSPASTSTEPPSTA